MATPKRRVLCTEDDADTRELIVLVLTGTGFDVKCADTAVEAIAMAKSESFDLYLVDNWMPGLTGPELSRKLREFDLKTPILFYSAAAFESDKEEARLAGAQGYLVKPAGFSELASEVSRLITESRPTKPSPLPSISLGVAPLL
jgi:DNA-binding response OmpR family regulator